eukprot:15133370-Alexandrium_andersonii.AAC.1
MPSPQAPALPPPGMPAPLPSAPLPLLPPAPGHTAQATVATQPMVQPMAVATFAPLTGSATSPI